MQLIKNLWNNLSTIFFAFIIAVIVWISAVLAADPNVQNQVEIPIEIIGLDIDQTLLGDIPGVVTVTISSPESVWEQISTNIERISASIDLSNLDSGEFFVPIVIDNQLKTARVNSINPAEVKVTIDRIISIDKAISVITVGELATGFQLDDLDHEDLWANVTGPETLVNLVDQVVAVLDISGKRDTISNEVVLQAFDADGQPVFGLEINPATTLVTQEISQPVGYRDVTVTLQLVGELERGYRLTNHSVIPSLVTLYSSDPLIIAGMPGFVRTEPVDLTGLTTDLEIRVLLELPEGVSLESEEKTVLVQIGITPIQSSDTIRIPLQVVGLTSGLEVVLPFEDIELLISGPLPVLTDLTPEDILLVVDLTDLEEGTFLVTPQVESIPDSLVIDTIISEIEVTIQTASTE